MLPRLKKETLILSFLLTFLFFAASSSAEVVHEVELQGNEALVTSRAFLETENEITHYDIKLELDTGAEVEGVENPSGEVSFELENDTLDLMLESGLPRKEHVFEMNWTVPGVKREQFPELMKVELGLFGFEGEETRAVVKDEEVLSWHEPLHYRSAFSNGSLKFSGESYLNLLAHSSGEGEATENYHYFQGLDVEEAEEFFPLLESVTGTENPHRRFPTVVLNDSIYDERMSFWSDGTYRTGGFIAVRENLTRFRETATLIHEATHGFNERALKWDGTGTDYYDEGLAQFTEFLVYEVVDRPRAEIFGESVDFREEGERRRFSSRSSAEELWNYYQDGEDWIVGWSPRNEQTDEARRFGYALSELIVRKHVEENGVESLRDVYKNLSEVEKRIEDPEEKAEIMERELETLRPCESDNRTEFERCLEEINDQDFEMEELEFNVTFDEREEIKVDSDLPSLEAEGYGLFEKIVLNLKRLGKTLQESITWISRKL
ncbi:MAG: hypothetical protein ACLFTQ_00665 [Candidatus Aenigmatarchaeota archaeon]